VKILVLNGSPKGETSVTMQYVEYLRKKFPGHEFPVIHVSQDIRNIEGDAAVFGAIMDAVKSTEIVLWAFPVYHMLVPSQYKRFIELLFSRDKAGLFQGKYTAVLSTSIHFFDHTAHRYMHGICDDLGMRYCGFYSAEMYDLLREPERDRLEKFAGLVFGMTAGAVPVPREYSPLSRASWSYVPGISARQVPAGEKKVVIVTDSDGSSPNLDKMTGRLMQIFSGDVEMINLHKLDIKGGCLGCCRCGYDNTCVYIDGYRDFYENRLAVADIIIMAGGVHDRDLSSAWKQFFDRSFFKGHTPGLAGKQVGYCIAGPLQQLPNLKEALTARADVGGYHALFVTDESGSSEELDVNLYEMAARLVTCSGTGYIPPNTFYAVGGFKIFRDHIYGGMRLPFQADYQYYREHGMFDFPQKEIRTRVFNAIIIPFTRIPGFRKKIFSGMKDHMVRPFHDVLEGA
jgi:multimeric flavodoxin WrbA